MMRWPMILTKKKTKTPRPKKMNDNGGGSLLLMMTMLVAASVCVNAFTAPHATQVRRHHGGHHLKNDMKVSQLSLTATTRRRSLPTSSPPPTTTTSLSLFKFMGNNNGNDDEKDTTKKQQKADEEKDKNENMISEKLQSAYDEFVVSLEEFTEKNIMSKLPEETSSKIKDNISKINDDKGSILSSIKVASISFVTGCFLTLCFVLYPLFYDLTAPDGNMKGIFEPVTLFETILTDLDTKYVDTVDTEKLFETGVSAMLRSLDPYTEFETKDDARALEETIGGKYGGVGLVISGTSKKDVELYKKYILNEGEGNGKSSSNKNYDVINTLDGSIRSSSGGKTGSSMLLPQDAINDQQQLMDSNVDDDELAIPVSSSPQQQQGAGSDVSAIFDDEDDDEEDMVIGEKGNNLNKNKKRKLSKQEMLERQKAIKKSVENGIRVVTAFEGYAYDYGMRVGDKIVTINNVDITPTVTVDDVRDMLRGDPNTEVTISFERDGVDGINTVTMPRTLVQLHDVKLATLVGNPKDNIGYIQLSGFAASAGKEMRQAILSLQQQAYNNAIGATADPIDPDDFHSSLKGLIIDLRGNPGGLLTSAVDVASQLVPKGSDIVSAKGRGFPGVLYRSRIDPILSPKTKLVVLVNGGTASAAEIVSGAVQDLDVGVIEGSDKTFGKGLVQNVEDLPFNTALKYTVAKYYTPSGRCIQATNYKEGGGNTKSGDDFDANGPSYTAKKVREKDKTIFYTKNGRQVRDGGGIEADYKVKGDKVSILEATLLGSGVMADFASQWSKTHVLPDNLDNIVDDKTYQEFINYVNSEQKNGNIKLEALYNGPMKELKKALQSSGYKGSAQGLEQLRQSIIKEINSDFNKYSTPIKEDISQSILARYLPESMLIERGLYEDKQVTAAIKLLKENSGHKFDQLLSRGSTIDNNKLQAKVTINTAKTIDVFDDNDATSISSSGGNGASSSSSTALSSTNNNESKK